MEQLANKVATLEHKLALKQEENDRLVEKTDILERRLIEQKTSINANMLTSDMRYNALKSELDALKTGATTAPPPDSAATHTHGQIAIHDLDPQKIEQICKQVREDCIKINDDFIDTLVKHMMSTIKERKTILDAEAYSRQSTTTDRLHWIISEILNRVFSSPQSDPPPQPNQVPPQAPVPTMPPGMSPGMQYPLPHQHPGFPPPPHFCPPHVCFPHPDSYSKYLTCCVPADACSATLATWISSQ